MNMSLKRKLSYEDSVSLSPPSSTLATSLPSSSQGSSKQTDPALDSPRAPTVDAWNIAGAPYFNSRTRKRFRDNRPDEDAIHERTLQKLYSAQKTLSQGMASHESDTQRQAVLVSPDTARHPRCHASAEMISGPPVRMELTSEPNQRSIDAFFSGSRPNSTRASSRSHSLLHTTAALQPHANTLLSILICEDCYAPLLAKDSGEAIDAEMLDVDGLGDLVDLEIDAGWQCAICTKWVCDTCAVRGDYRVCLECAVPGGGRYRANELKAKRWVGGVGWM